MKTLSIILALFFCVSCSKDDDTQPEGTFDVNSPEGYFLYVKNSNAEGSFPTIMLFEFTYGKTVRIYDANTEGSFPYTIIGDNTIELSNTNLRFVFDGDIVSSSKASYREIVLIKAPESNQLVGKTFAGTYYKANMTVLHDSFFYSFSDGENTVDAGLNIGATLRTESYMSVGNFAARVELDNGEKEFMILVNGKLEVNYVENGVAGKHYGTFTQQ